MRAKALAALVGVACTSALAVGVAWAGGGVTKVTIGPPRNSFGLHGRVFSKRKACEVGRTIEVLRAKGPHQDPSSDTVVGTTTSVMEPGHGFWNLSTTPHSGFYYAYATKTSNCRAGVSPILHLGS